MDWEINVYVPVLDGCTETNLPFSWNKILTQALHTKKLLVSKLWSKVKKQDKLFCYTKKDEIYLKKATKNYGLFNYPITCSCQSLKVSSLCFHSAVKLVYDDWTHLHPFTTSISDAAHPYYCHLQRIFPSHEVSILTLITTKRVCVLESHRQVGSSLLASLLPKMIWFLPGPTCQSLTSVNNKLYLFKTLSVLFSQSVYSLSWLKYLQR